ncbi:MAG: hypothetical protein EF813_08350 [Methanosarcinales archaeon]|nr:MAG: hypothetical protein EF813_08350 [Methanosarcinales archaeon]
MVSSRLSNHLHKLEYLLIVSRNLRHRLIDSSTEDFAMIPLFIGATYVLPFDFLYTATEHGIIRIE